MAEKSAVFETNIPSLELLHRGKVRDVYAIDAERLLIVTTDRLSAFDVILPDPVPFKGEVLTQISNFWFNRTTHIVPNHLTPDRIEDVVGDRELSARLARRSIVTQRLRALPIEAVVRGYLIGSGWRDYRRTGAVCGIVLPDNLRQADRLAEPIFSPATKAAVGDHDENITFSEAEELIGKAHAEAVRAISITLYTEAVQYARERGIIIADTKFEFGLDKNDRLVLIDEVLTPDSSRFWPVDQYRPGISPPSFDKQYVRDYLDTLDWDKRPPGPRLPQEIIEKTSEKYQEALRRLTGETLVAAPIHG